MPSRLLASPVLAVPVALLGLFAFLFNAPWLYVAAADEVAALASNVEPTSKNVAPQRTTEVREFSDAGLAPRPKIAESPNEVEAIIKQLESLGAIVRKHRGVATYVYLKDRHVTVAALPQILSLIARVDTITGITFLNVTPTRDDFRRLAAWHPTGLCFIAATLAADDVETLATSAKLEWLSFSGCRFEGDVVPAFGKLQRLKSLDIVSSDHLEGNLFLALASLPKLTHFRITEPRLGDERLLGLRHCESLEHLTIESDELTDAVYDELENKPNLKELDLRGARLSPAGAQNFRARHPQLYFDRLAQEGMER